MINSREDYQKDEFYKAFIGMQKLSGQGTSGIVKVQGGPIIAAYLDELIEEGLCIAVDTGGSLGHPESNIFYLPSKGYNVWAEQNSMGSLECVRYYIAKLDNPDDPYEGDRFLGITDENFQEGGNFFEFYNEWLERNQEALDEMFALSDVYPGE
jgi:hypothetical protein